jgi:hypothetical protein
MKRHIAEQVAAALINAYVKISKNLSLVMMECTQEEVFAYRRGTGGAMGYLADILGPILREHPDLEPEEWKGPYQKSEGGISIQFNTSGRPMERSIAEQALAALKDASLKVNTALSLIEKECTEEEIVAYREAAETAMGYVSRDLIEPILRQHPDLAPKGTPQEEGPASTS